MLPLPGSRSASIFADVHIHTAYSHGQASAAEMYQAAVAAGLRIIGFSEHSPRPVGYTYPSDYQERLIPAFPRYVDDIRALAAQAARTKHTDIRVLLGVELDYIPGTEDVLSDFYASYPFDYNIGGLHFQGTWGFDGPAEVWEGMGTSERFAAYAQYYKDLAAMCRTGIFHIAAHPDLIKISSVPSFREWLDTPESLSLIRTALEALRDNGMLMEVSSAGLRKACAEIYPGPRIMQLAREVGVSISFASDAHCKHTPAADFDMLAHYARSFGFTEYGIACGGKKELFPLAPPAQKRRLTHDHGKMRGSLSLPAPSLSAPSLSAEDAS